MTDLLYTHCLDANENHPFARFAMASVMAAAEAAELAKQDKKQRQYTAPDGGVRVVVVPVGKEAGRSEYESRIGFKSSDGKIACALDYSSETAYIASEWCGRAGERLVLLERHH